MFVENKHKTDVVCIKMDSTEEIVGKIKEETNDDYVIGNPKKVVVVEQEEMDENGNAVRVNRAALGPFMLSNPDIGRVHINKSKVIAISDASPEFAEGFNNSSEGKTDEDPHNQGEDND